MYKCGSWHGQFVFDREMMAVHNGLLREVLGTETLVEPLKRTLNAAVEVDIHKFPGVGKFRSWCKEANQGRGMRHFYSYGMVISAIEEEVEAESEPKNSLNEQAMLAHPLTFNILKSEGTRSPGSSR